MRKLVTVRQVSDIQPIEGADFIVLAKVDGWQCIAKKGEFEVGDFALYYELDSALPVDDDRYEFLHKSCKKKFAGGEVLRIKTMKMKGELSQGLLLPITSFPEVQEVIDEYYANDKASEIMDHDFSELLRVVKYEKEVSAPNAAGDFPWFIRKTDQERIQNQFKRLERDLRDEQPIFVPTLKLDGSSCTLAYVTDPTYKVEKLQEFEDEDGGQFIVCSRNVLLKPDTENKWYLGADDIGAREALKQFHENIGRNIALQGELVGPGIQGEHEKHHYYTIYAFAIFDIDNQEYLSYSEFAHICDFHLRVKRAPQLMEEINILESFSNVEDYLSFAENIPSEIAFADIPEGVVFHKKYGKPYSFKAISNQYLMHTD